MGNILIAYPFKILNFKQLGGFTDISLIIG